MKYKTKDSQFDKAIYFVSRYPLIIDELLNFFETIRSQAVIWRANTEYSMLIEVVTLHISKK